MSSAPDAWAHEAACRGHLDLFYAPHAERPPARAHREAAARSVCATCPVRQPCRAFARTNLELGLWGGETEAERSEAGFPARMAPTVPVRRSHSSPAERSGQERLGWAPGGRRHP